MTDKRYGYGWETKSYLGVPYYHNIRTGEIKNMAGQIIDEKQTGIWSDIEVLDWLKGGGSVELPTDTQRVIEFLADWARRVVAA